MTPDPRLLIPLAEVPGLDPVGLVVYLQTFPSGAHSPAGICIRSDGRTHWLTDEDKDTWDLSAAATLSLDDAATRDRVLRWLAGRVGLDVGCGAPGWRWVDANPAQFDPGNWELSTGVHDAVYFMQPGHAAVCHLDPTDDTRTDDGARLVDCLALKAVALFIGGRNE